MGKHRVTVSAADAQIYIHNDGEGGGYVGVPRKTFDVAQPGEERWRYPGDPHSFCDPRGSEVGIDLWIPVRSGSSGTAQARVELKLFENTTSTCSASELDGSAETEWFKIAPGQTEHRYLKVNNTDESGDYAFVTVYVTNEVIG
jgi:hypothetical protein